MKNNTRYAVMGALFYEKGFGNRFGGSLLFDSCFFVGGVQRRVWIICNDAGVCSVG